MGTEVEENWVYCAECAGSGDNAWGGMCESCGGLGELLDEAKGANDELA